MFGVAVEVACVCWRVLPQLYEVGQQACLWRRWAGGEGFETSVSPIFLKLWFEGVMIAGVGGEVFLTSHTVTVKP